MFRTYSLWPFLFSLLVFLVSAPLHAEEGACKPLASIYEQDICASAVMPNEKLEKNIREYAGKSKQNPEKAIEDFKISSLFGLLWEKALVHKYGADSIEPSKREIESYLKSFHKAIEHQNDMNEDMGEFITELLEDNDYTPENVQRLKTVSAQKQKAMMMYNMRDALPDEMRAQMEEGERKMAAAMVKSWKIKKTLFEDYGGRVIFQQAGLEPLDAFQSFVKELEESGAAVIHDPAYKGVFKTMDEYAAKNHNFLPKDSKEIEDYFDSPSWMYDGDIAKEAFKQEKAALQAIPTIEKE